MPKSLSWNLPTPEQAAKSAEIRGKMAVIQKQLDTETPALREAQQRWEVEMRSAEKQWQVLSPLQAESAGGATLEGAARRLGARHRQESASGQLHDSVEDRTQNGITAVRLEVLPDESLPKGGPGRDPEGNFFLSAFDVERDAAGLIRRAAEGHLRHR